MGPVGLSVPSAHRLAECSPCDPSRKKIGDSQKPAFNLSLALRRPVTYQFAMMAWLNEPENPAASSQSSGSDSFPEEPQNNRNNFSYANVSTKLVAI
jgi:hypothetical protein